MSEWVERHLPCDDCGSSDALSINSDGFSTCFSCNKRRKVRGEIKKEVKVSAPLDNKAASKFEDAQYRSIQDRGINRETCETYKCLKEGDQITFGYTNPQGQIVATKARGVEKKFNIKGDWGSAGLYGQSLFRSGGKYVTITEGEFDALAAYQMLGSKWPVVSIKSGAQSALRDCKAHFEYLNSFDNIVICFDNDEAGQEATEKVAALFGTKAKVYRHQTGYKDACDYLDANKGKLFSDRWWEAEQYSPVGIVHLADMWDDFIADPTEKIPFPASWSTLNDMMNGGIERGEVTVIGALTSIGKSSVINSIAYHLMDNTNYKVGAMYLEGTKREVVRDMLSLDMATNLRTGALPDEEILKKHWDAIAAKDNFIFVDHQGSLDNDKILAKLEYLAKGANCDIIIIDPIQAAVDSSQNGDVIQFMDAILKFAKETNTSIILASHMRKPDGGDAHAVSEYNLLGSSSINQIAFNTILLSRDKLAEEPEKRNATKLQLVKCRRTGETGPAGWLRYDKETTHLFATDDPYEVLEEL